MSQNKLDEEDVLIFSTLSILQLIKECQLQHGLRHGDYQRYRAYCSRKLQRIRKSTKLTHTHKRGKDSFQSKHVTPELVKSLTCLLIPLFDAERSWAYAMQLKQESNSEPRKKFHLARRMKKAVQHSAELESLCKALDAVDARSKLEAQAYNSWMHGFMYFESEQWQQSLEAFTSASMIYEKLGAAVADSDPELQGLYKQRVQEMSPQMRYCQYNIGDKSAVQDLVNMRQTLTTDDNISSDLDVLIAQTRISAKAAKPEITWCTHKISTERPPKAQAFCATIGSLEGQLSKATDLDTKVSMMERFVMDCRDILQAVRDEFKSENFRVSADSDEQLTNAQLLHSYLNYVRLSKTADRYLLIIGGFKCSVEGEGGDGDKKSAKPQDLVRLYDAVIQNLSEIESLPGINADGNFVQGVQSRIVFYKALRCYYILESLRASGKWEEVYVLCRRALEYCTEVKGLLRGLTSTPDDISKSRLELLEQKLNVMKYTAYANCIVEEDEEAAVQGEEKAVIDPKTFSRIAPSDIAKGKVALVQLPPDFQPVPAKPLFYDLALNHVTFPAAKLKEKMGLDESKKDEAKDGGLTGFVKGWIWGKK